MKKFRDLYFQLRPGYIRKQDAYHYLRSQRIIKSILFIILGILLFVWPVQMLTQLFGFYESVDVPVPVFTQRVPYLFVILAIIYFGFGVYMIVSKPDKKNITELIHHSDKADQIKVIELYEKKDFEIPLVMSLLLLIFLILSSLAIYLPMVSLGN